MRARRGVGVRRSHAPDASTAPDWIVPDERYIIKITPLDFDLSSAFIIGKIYICHKYIYT